MKAFRELQKTALSGASARHHPDQPILSLKGVTLRYENHKALDDISFHLHPGERVAVVGPNGAGKSTLFKVIAGVLTPSEGDVRIAGERPGGHICIAYVPQRTQVDWNFPVNVSDVVMMGRIGQMGPFRWPRRRDRELVASALAEVGLSHLAHRQISELSGGQQQRMFIARALAQEAEIMLMDEPLNGLDVRSVEAIFEILDDLRQRRVTVLLATHDLDQAARRFDRVMLINRRLAGFGLPEQVLTTENLLAAYGGHLRLMQAEGKVYAIGDTCCDEHDHAH
jgi:manganese/iron transport system ATP-binding protein